MQEQWVRIFICNLNAKTKNYGYGKGKTKDEAIADALRKVKTKFGVDGFYDYGQVCFRGNAY